MVLLLQVASVLSDSLIVLIFTSEAVMNIKMLKILQHIHSGDNNPQTVNIHFDFLVFESFTVNYP